MSRRRLSPKKLLHSKWTAVAPVRREKHFVVVAIETDPLDEQKLEKVVLEAVLPRRRRTLDWRELADAARWRQGWSNAA